MSKGRVNYRGTRELTSASDARLRDVFRDLNVNMRRGVIEQAQDSVECGVQDLPDSGYDLVVPHPIDWQIFRLEPL